MAQPYRRVLLKPADLGEPQHEALTKALSAAVAMQKQLAGRSPHILQFLGELRETESCYYIDHEPASPFSTETILAPEAPLGIPDTVLRVAIAVLDALRAAGTTEGRRPVAHGGLCPGVLLVDPNGVEKVTDFGFAPAVCTALGKGRFLDLAVGPPRDNPPIDGATGVWRMLSPNVHNDSNRICAFIDPEKHGTKLYTSFEPSSDIVAAGLLLYLLAEHRHPYFYYEDTFEALRSVDVAEQMAYTSLVFFDTLHDDLKNSPDPRIRVWKEVLWRMMDRLPQGRLTAAEAVKQLSEVGVKPAEPTQVFSRKLEIICDHIQAANWSELASAGIDSDLQPITQSGEAPREIAEAAGFLLSTCHLLKAMTGPDWQEAARAILNQQAPVALPEGITRRVLNLRARVEQNLAVEHDMGDIETALTSGIECTDLRAVETLQRKLDQLVKDELLVPALTDRLASLHEKLAQRFAELDPNFESVRVATVQWLDTLRSAADRNEWALLERGLEERDRHPIWLPEFREQIQELERRLEEARRLRDKCLDDLRQAEELFSKNDLAAARALAEPLVEQMAHAGIADRAKAVISRIAREEDRLRREQEDISNRLQTASDLLDAVVNEIRNPSGVDPQALKEMLETAEGHVRQVADKPELPDAQKQSVGQMTGRLASTKEGVLRLADQQLKDLERREQQRRHLALARREFESGHLIKAKQLVEISSRSEFSDIADDGKALLKEVDAAFEGRRRPLHEALTGAETLFRQGDCEGTIVAARGVMQDDYADVAIREWAQRLVQQAEAAIGQQQEGRHAAVADNERAEASLRQGDLVNTRRWAENVLGNPHAEEPIILEVRRLLDILSPLESAQTFADQQDFRQAIRAFDGILESAPPDSLAAQAATALRRQAMSQRSQVLAINIRKRLEARARQDLAPGEGDSPVVQSSLPEWLQNSLAVMDTFMSGHRVAAQAPQPTLPPGEKFGGKYEIMESLGRGGMGEVYRARDLELDREVALKLAPAVSISPELSKALENEAKAIARLKHPNIMHINSSGVMDGRRYFDTDYIHGADLGRHLKGQGEENRGIPPRRVAEILIPIAEALDYAHQQGVLHRDVKPQNIYLGEEQYEGPWLIDFGLAYMRSITHIQATTGLCGTPGYIAPEVISSLGAQADQRADIFALGCVLYEMLSGRPPFVETPSSPGPVEGKSRMISKIMLNTIRNRFRRLSEAAPDAPPELVEICRRAMAEDPERRYQRAAEMAGDLRRFLHGVERQEIQTSLEQARKRFEQRRRNQSEELDDLAEARRLAELVKEHGSEEHRKQAEALLGEVEAVWRDITAVQTQAGKDLLAAKQAFATGEYETAVHLAKSIIENPYAHDLHDEARGIAQQAEEALLAQAERQARTRRRRKITATFISVAALIGVIAVTYLRPHETPVVGPQTPPNITVSCDKTTIPENGGQAVLTLDLNRPAKEGVKVHLGFGGTATQPGDYTIEELASNETRAAIPIGESGALISIDKSAARKQFAITARDNQIVDGPRTATITVGETVGATPLGLRTVNLTIADDDSTGIDVNPRGDLTLTEGGEPRELTVKLKSQPVQPVIVTWTQKPACMTISPPKLTFNKDNWSKDQTVQFKAVPDKFVTGMRGVTVTATSESEDPKYKGLSSTPVAVNIADADTAQVAFVAGEREVERSELPGYKIPIQLTISGNGSITAPVPIQIIDAEQGSLLGRAEFPAGTTSGPRDVPLDKTAADALKGPLVKLKLRFSEQFKESSARNQVSLDEAAQCTLTVFDVVQLAFTSAGGSVDREGLQSHDIGLTYAIPKGKKISENFVVQAINSGKVDEILGAVTVNGASGSSSQNLRIQNVDALKDKDSVTIGLAIPPEAKAILAKAYLKERIGQPSTHVLVITKVRSDRRISPEAVVAQLRTLAPKEATGPDGWLRVVADKGTVKVAETKGPSGEDQWAVNIEPWGGEVWPDLRMAKSKLPDDTAVAAALLDHMKKDSVSTKGLRDYIATWPERKSLQDRIGGRTNPSAEDAWQDLLAIGRIKWRTPGITDSAKLDGWTRRLRAELKGRKTNDAYVVEPGRFVEYFWGTDSVHALCWQTDNNGSVGSVRYLKLGDSARVQELVRAALQLEDRGSGQAFQELGKTLMEPVVRQEGFLVSTGDSFGVSLSPDGPICFLSLAALPFASISPKVSTDMESKTDTTRGISVSIDITKLADLCAMNRDDNANQYIAVWTMVSLAPAPPSLDASRPECLWEGPWKMVSRPGYPSIGNLRIDEMGVAVSGACFVYGYGGPNDQATQGWLMRSCQEIAGKLRKNGSRLDGGFAAPRLTSLETLPRGIPRPPGVRMCVPVADPVAAQAR